MVEVAGVREVEPAQEPGAPSDIPVWPGLSNLQAGSNSIAGKLESQPEHLERAWEALSNFVEIGARRIASAK